MMCVDNGPPMLYSVKFMTSSALLKITLFDWLTFFAGSSAKNNSFVFLKLRFQVLKARRMELRGIVK